MLSKAELQEDLNDICAQTKGRWLCYDDIHTKNLNADTTRYLKELKRLGYSKTNLLSMGYLDLAYGGGLEIRHQEESKGAGYTLDGKNNNKNKLVVLSGFARQNDRHTVYHEAAHLYQFEYNIFNIRYRGEYETYLSETHANTFAAAVLLLKAKNVFEYKKQRLALFANNVNMVNDKRKKLLYYLSLPIELEMVKIIRKEGRANVRAKFEKKGRLDFKKIAFWTADLVREHAYTKEEFEKIQKGDFTLRYELLKKKAKSYRVLGRAFSLQQKLQKTAQNKRHYKIEKQRIETIKEKLKPLPEKNKQAQMINAACALDNFQVRLLQEYGIFDALSDVVDGEVCSVPDKYKQNAKALDEISATFEKMKTIYQRWQNEAYFQDLVDNLLFIETRDEVWASKEEMKKNLQRRDFEFGLQNER
ncbi:MAG TPA: hypothetical protein DIC64_00525 [Alphaproteobacteria bacterium]|nr:hypothetical protein [Alphaproteobacteria bacterium]